MEELWLPIPGFPDYQVSNLGRVQSKLSGQWKDRKLKLINKGKNYHKTYYYGINVKVNERLPSGNYKKTTLKIHKLVAKLFIGPNPGGLLVLHKDDNRANNRWDNLVYGTNSDNLKMSYENGNRKVVRKSNGQFNGSEGT